MSRYGRLYDRASELRRRLCERLPSLTGNYTPADAKLLVRKQATQQISVVDQLAEEWAALEDKMRNEEG